MAKASKSANCQNCNTPLPVGAKICPSCGAKNKKPFYKRGWVILLTAILAIGIIGVVGCGSKGEKFEWSSLELSALLPEPNSHIGEILSDSEDYLSIYVHKTAKEEYKDYLNACKSFGYTLESSKTESNYSAYNEAGYKLSLWYNSNDKELHISLDAPMEMATLSWPESGIASLLPAPLSKAGNIQVEASDKFYVYVGETSKEDYDAYVTACTENGFSVNYEKNDKYYSADNENGVHLSLQYRGGNIMYVEIAEREHTGEEGSKAVEDSGTAAIPDSTAASAEQPLPTENTTSASVSDIDPEFKEAMDSYEAFYDEYCDFMKKYKENPTDLKLLAKYSEMVTKLAEMNEKFEAWDKDEMNEAELKYYLEVNARVTQKLAEAAK